MKVQKIGHCCLIIETKNLRIMTDPGRFSSEQNKVTNIDIVLITHEHTDHLHVDSLKEVIKNNPQATVICNVSVGKILAEQAIGHVVVDGSDTREIKGISIESFEAKHEEIYKEVGQVQNTAYFIDKKLFYPGDSFYNPKQPVEILAFPIAGPWCRIADAIKYALAVAPKRAFPVHESVIVPDFIPNLHKMVAGALKDSGTEFVPLLAGESKEF